LRTSLRNERVFNDKECVRILRDLDAVVVNGGEGLPAEVIRLVFGRLIEDAVRY
jgi:hypothetical protein